MYMCMPSFVCALSVLSMEEWFCVFSMEEWFFGMCTSYCCCALLGIVESPPMGVREKVLELCPEFMDRVPVPGGSRG